MTRRPDRHTTPADLVALAVRVQQHERAADAERLAEARRCREAIDAQPAPPTSDIGRLRCLVELTGDDAVAHAGRRARSALALVGLILVVLGLLSGVLIASGVFYYDGRSPVNVVAALGVFVVLQCLLLVLSCLAALPRTGVAWLPGMEGVQEALRLASPGRLALVAARMLPQDMREALAAAMGTSGAHQRIYGRVQLWAVLRWSQLYSVALNLAAVATFLYLVFFSDLAFGWSTTLKLQASEFHQIVHSIALPWAWHDTLTPSLELVERSRYYRGTPFNPEQRGAWWPFVLTAMLVYGLLPRIIALIVCSLRLRRATDRAFVATPGASDLLSLLRGAAPLPAEASDPATSAEQAAARATLGQRPAVIDWSRAAGSTARAAALLGAEPCAYEPAGGARSVADDLATIQAITGSVNADGVALLVKLWEPPVIETTEFLRELREAVGENITVRVVPVASDPAGRVIGDTDELITQWRRRVRAIGDPWTSVADAVGLSNGQAEVGDA